MLLTTQYLEEADRLADSITVLDLGRVIAHGTPDELKRQTGGQVLEVQPAKLSTLADAPVTGIDRDTTLVTVPLQDTAPVAVAVRRLDEAEIAIAELTLRRPSLDDVFLQLTGHRAEMNEPGREAS